MTHNEFSATTGGAVVADALPLVVWSTQDGGRVVYVSSAWSRLTGVSAAAARDDGYLRAVHPADRDGLLQALQAGLAGNTHLESEHRLRNAAGDYRWHLVRAQPLPEAGTDL